MGIRFILMVNKQGQTRLAQNYEWLTHEERRALEGEIVRKCLARNEQQCSFDEHPNYKIAYRRYASLFFLVGVDNDKVSSIPFLSPSKIMFVIVDVCLSFLWHFPPKINKEMLKA
ncbi:AP-4 complex subunit sigma-like [Hibiscus syriacus]|uniref:AP-4 complex subunit sigma-like n=1 Tax=Hibiscus syriacus TaxID=106335 RepID=UPI0019234EDB|nr:AP-4 complex subunit sigma-like [Hibiscus syriacus]